MNIGILITLSFILAFILFWCLILFLISKISGWSKIAATNPFNEMNAGNKIEKINFNSITIGYQTKMSGTITITFYEYGMMIKPMLMFRAFNSPIFFGKEILKKGTYRGTDQIGVFQIDTEGKQLFIYGKVAARINSFTKSKNPYF